MSPISETIKAATHLTILQGLLLVEPVLEIGAG